MEKIIGTTSFGVGGMRDTIRKFDMTRDTLGRISTDGMDKDLRWLSRRCSGISTVHRNTLSLYSQAERGDLCWGDSPLEYIGWENYMDSDTDDKLITLAFSIYPLSFGFNIKNNNNLMTSYEQMMIRLKKRSNSKILNKLIGGTESMKIYGSHGVTRVIDKGINTVLDESIEYGKNSLKRKFGKEFYFQWNEHSEIIRTLTSKFIKKYDKNFNNHTVEAHEGDRLIMNKQFILHIDNRTFMYITTGNKLPGTEERFLMNSQISDKDLYLYVCGLKANKYIKDIEKITHDIYNNKEIGIFSIDASQGGYGQRGDEARESLDVVYQTMQPRNMDTLFFSHGEKDAVISHIERFNDTKEFYTQKQLLYKTGILLHGEPGTGKSSLVKAMASTYNRSIVNVNISNLAHIDLAKLTQAINVDENREYIILLEDIDTLFLNREGQTDKEANKVINKMLQFLDSNTSPTNVIFVGTTNHLDRLDKALLREGRFDLKVECLPLTDRGAIEFAVSFSLSEEVAKRIVEEIHEQFPDAIGINQSLMQARILANLEGKTSEKAAELYGVMVDSSEEKVKEKEEERNEETDPYGDEGVY